MIKRIYALMLISLLVASCVKNDVDDVNVDDNSNQDGKIAFGLGADWTRGANIEDTGDIPSLTVYSYYADYSKTDAESWDYTTASDLLPFFTSSINTPFTLTNEDYGKVDVSTYSWSYTGGSRYWPWGADEKISFIALYPSSELTHTPDETTGKPTFSYTGSTLASENDDLVLDAKFDMTLSDTPSSNGYVDLDLQHLLTKLSLEVSYTGSINEGEELGFVEYFYVNGISFSGIYNDATLNINADGSTSWTTIESSTIELTAAQDNTILPIYDALGAIIPANRLTTTSTSVMEEGEAIFVLPQQLGSDRTTAPTAKVRIRRVYFEEDDYNVAEALYTADKAAWDSDETKYTDFPYTLEDDYLTTPSGELLYSTTAITIPSADGSDGWVAGEHNVLSFEFDLSKLSEYDTPLTLTSQIYDWTELDIEVTVHANTYIYTSDGDFELSVNESTADMYVYTNYSSDLRISKTNKELDGTLTTANGFTFYPDGTDVNYTPQLVSPTSAYGEEVLLTCTYDPETETYSVGDTDLTTYEDADGYPDMSAYFWTGTVPGDAVACYSYGNYTGEMTDTAKWLKFKITTTSGYYFYFYSALLTRGQLGLYTNSAVETDYYGVNKSENDAVYILRLEIQDSHLMNEAGDDFADLATDAYGYFSGAIGAEMLSNGGGKITYKFDVSLKKALN